MPIYEYRCPKCRKVTESYVPVMTSATPICKTCNESAYKIPSTFGISMGPLGTKTLWDEANFRAQSEKMDRECKAENDSRWNRYFDAAGVE